jgi:glycosyltransferase involved in cell wall biosynthesis
MVNKETVAVTITVGEHFRSDAAIAVIIISTNSDPRTKVALQSIIANDYPAEIVVVNTGAGTICGELQDYLPHIRLIETDKKQFAGGARNLGILNSTAPIVSFLAADCIAPPGWLSARVDGHSHFSTVSSTLMPAPNSEDQINDISWASYFVTHFERVPKMHPKLAKPFGLSYSRNVFKTHGLFEDKMPTGEDTVFNRKISHDYSLGTECNVVTLHSYPTTLTGACRLQFNRGRREYSYYRAVYRRNRVIVAGRSLKRLVQVAAHSFSIRTIHPHGKAVSNLGYFVLLSALRIAGNLAGAKCQEN